MKIMAFVKNTEVDYNYNDFYLSSALFTNEDYVL